MSTERTLFRELQRLDTHLGRAGARQQEKVERMDAVARDIIERGGTTDAEEFIFAIHGVVRSRSDGYEAYNYYRSVEKSYDQSAVGKIFVSSGISMRTNALAESPVYYLADRPKGTLSNGKIGATPIEYRIERNDKMPPSTYVGKLVVPNVLVIQDEIKSITTNPTVTAGEYVLKNFTRFVGQDGMAPEALFGVPPISSPLSELDIIKSLSRKKRGIVDMGDVVAYAAGLGNARIAFWQFEQQQRQNQMNPSI